MKMMVGVGLCLACLLGLVGCDYFAGSGSDSTVEQASQHYQQSQDLESLEALHKQLKPGMTRSEVEALLGAAQYSPLDGVDYYPAEKNDPQQSANVGLVIEYLNEQSEATNQVQKFWLGEVGE